MDVRLCYNKNLGRAVEECSRKPQVVKEDVEGCVGTERGGSLGRGGARDWMRVGKW